MIISLSNFDSGTASYDMYNENMELMHDIVRKTEFNLSDLLQLYCLSQKYYSNTPVIGYKNIKAEIKQFKLSEFIGKINSDCVNKSEATTELLKANGINVVDIFEKIKTHQSIATLVPDTQNLYLEIIAAIYTDLDQLFGQNNIFDLNLRPKYISAAADNVSLRNGLSSKLMSLIRDDFESPTLALFREEFIPNFYSFSDNDHLYKMQFAIKDYLPLIKYRTMIDMYKNLMETGIISSEQEPYNFISCQQVKEQFESWVEDYENQFPIPLCSTYHGINEERCLDQALNSIIPDYSILLAMATNPALTTIYNDTIEVLTSGSESITLSE